MRHAFLTATATAALFGFSPVALAQTAPIEVRVDRLEKEVRAVQRKIFPGGAPVEAEITRTPTPAVQAGTPATSAVSDLIARVDALESQLATLTGQTEQNAYKIKQLEDNFNRYKAETDGRLATSAPDPAAAGDTAAAPTTPAPKPASRPAAAKPDAAPPKAAPTGASEARKLAVAAVEKPDTGDEALDAYTYGFRLWTGKFYPEAQAQLKAAVEKFGATPTGSRTANLLGRAYLDDGKPALASVAFYENYQKRPKGDRAADSLAWLGEALIQLKKPADACKVYGELDSVYGSALTSTQKAMMEKGKAKAKCS